MSDRLAELRRQRALLSEHVAWLDREIAAESAKTGGTRPASAAPSSETKPPASATISSISALIAPNPTAASAPADADAILNEYRVAPDTLKTDVRKGCLLYFTLALVLLGAAVALLWLAFRYNAPPAPPPQPAKAKAP